MKKILFAALAALAITSCTQNEEIEAPSQKSEMKFNTAVSKTSRATALENKDFQAFKAYAYNHTNAWASAESFNAFFSNIDYSTTDKTNWIGKDASNATQTFYWPTTDYVSFFAYSVATMNDVTAWSGATTTSTPTFKYTVKTGIDKQEDLVVAELIDKKKASSGETEAVSLNFKHALTKISFDIKCVGVGLEYTVNSIKINAKGTGVYKYKATGTSDTSLGEWTTEGENIAYTISLDADDKTMNGSDDNAVTKSLSSTPKYTAMLIPQALTGISIEVNYKATLNGALICDKESASETIDLSSSTATWESGKSIVYTLKLKGAEKMDISGKVTDAWDSNGAEELPKDPS